MLFSDMFDRAATRAVPSKPFLMVDGQATMYGDLLDRIARLYALFDAKGLRRGDRIGIVTESVPDMAALLLAGLRSGLAMINLNTELSPRERRHALAASGVSHVFIDRTTLDTGPIPTGIAHTIIEPSERRSAGGLIGRLLGGKQADRPATDGLNAEIATAQPVEAPDPVTADATGLMLFTSGTTNVPKVVQLSHRNLAAQLATFLKVYDYDTDSNILNPLPLHFTDGIMHGPMIAFLTGATLFRPRNFMVQELETLLHGVYRDRITHFIVVPAILSLIDRLHTEFDEAFRTRDFRYIRSSGDRLPESLWCSIQSRFGVKVVNTYGLSETVCEALYCGPDEDRYRMGTIGKPVDCEIRIVDDAGADVPEGETGELLIRGDNIMQGYFRQPELTAQVITGGWFSTGDFAAMDTDGFVTIIGRKKALIISGGTNIHPQDVTDVLLGHPAVAEAMTFGLPDPVWGEMVASAVVPRDGGGGIPVPVLIDHCRRHLAPHKVPRVLKIMDSLPRNPAGKILVDELKAMVDADHAVNFVRADLALEEQILEVAARVFGCDSRNLKLSSEARTTFGWDSLAHMNLVLATEEVFGIDLSPRDILSVSRLEHLKDLVARHRAVPGEVNS